MLPACLVSLVGGPPGLGSDRRQLSGGRDGKLGKVNTATAKVVQLLEQQLEHRNGMSGLPLRPTEPRTGILQAALLKEASVPRKISAKAPVTSRGKFALSTGAWYMNDEYVRAHGGNGTRVCPPKHHCGYKLDKKLVSCLAKLFAGHTVTELGAGVGLYQQSALDTGNVLSWTAYDGMPDIETLTHERDDVVRVPADPVAQRLVAPRARAQLAPRRPPRREGGVGAPRRGRAAAARWRARSAWRSPG